MATCGCSGGLFDTGRPNYAKGIDQDAKIFLTYLKKEDGTQNKISQADILAGIDDTYIDALINNTDPFSRIYPIGPFNNQVDERGDPVTEGFNDGTEVIVREAPRTYNGVLVGYGSEDLKILQYWACKSIGIYGVTKCGDLVGREDGEGGLLPVPIEQGTWYPRLMKGTNEAISKVMLQFQVGKLFNDSEYRRLGANGTYLTADLLDKEGLIQLALSETTPPTTTGFAVALTVDYGKEWAQDPAAGFGLADFTLYNTTTASSVVPDSVTEAPDGTYTFVIPAQTSGDVLRLSLIADGKSLEETLLTAIAP